MPDLNGAAERQYALHNRDQTIAENRDQQQLSAIEKIRQGAGKKAEGENRNALGEAGQAQLKRRTGELVNLIKVLRLAHLLRRGCEQRKKKD